MCSWCNPRRLKRNETAGVGVKKVKKVNNFYYDLKRGGSRDQAWTDWLKQIFKQKHAFIFIPYNIQ